MEDVLLGIETLSTLLDTAFLFNDLSISHDMLTVYKSRAGTVFEMHPDNSKDVQININRYRLFSTRSFSWPKFWNSSFKNKIAGTSLN